MTDVERAILEIGDHISDLVLTDTAIKIMRSGICFTGDEEEFRELIQRGLEASLELMSDDSLFAILMERKRQARRNAGLPVLSDEDEGSSKLPS